MMMSCVRLRANICAPIFARVSVRARKPIGRNADGADTLSNRIPYEALKSDVYRNSANGYEERIGLAWLWRFLFGALYFAVKGVWTHAIGSIFIVIMTLGLAGFVYPFFAGDILRKHYLRRGWQPVR